MILSFEGIDGAGKTTLARLLGVELSRRGIRTEVHERSSIDFADPYVARQMAQLRELIWPSDEPPTSELGTHYSLYLLAAWYSALQQQRIPEIIRSGDAAIFDGWYYRVIVKAFLRAGFDRDWLQSLFRHLHTPDRVILLDIDPELVWHRRCKFKPTELGRWDGHRGSDFEAFCTYQARIRAELLTLAEERKWFVVRQSGESENVILEKILSGCLEDFIHRRPAVLPTRGSIRSGSASQ